MSALGRACRLPVPSLIVLLTLVPLPASANPMAMPDPRLFQRIMIFGLLWLLIVLVEGAFIKLMLFGLDGPSWPRAFLLAVLVNVSSAVVGAVSGMRFDWWEFRFYPNLLAVLGISLVAEGVVLVVLFAPWRLRRVAVTNLVMNLASYTLLILARFPGNAANLWDRY